MRAKAAVSFLAVAAFLSSCDQPSAAPSANTRSKKPPGLERETDLLPVEGLPPAKENLARNGSFEEGDDRWADDWDVSASRPPIRTYADAHTGTHSIHANLLNLGATPSEGILRHTLIDAIDPGRTYALSLWAKQVDFGASYVQEYQITWIDEHGQSIADTGLKPFRGGDGSWENVLVSGLEAPRKAAGARLKFRFVTGAIRGGSGEVFLDDISFHAVE